MNAGFPSSGHSLAAADRDAAPRPAAALLSLVHAAEIDLASRRWIADRARAEERRRRVEAMAETRLSEADWRAILDRAETAAGRGEREILILRFPSELCEDRGRAVNAPDPDWPKTLRGIAADVFTRWHDELRPLGYGLTAQVLDFPEGFLGDVGLTLRWG